MLGEKSLDALVSGDPPGRASTADVVVAEGVGLAADRAVIVLAGADGAEKESCGDLG